MSGDPFEPIGGPKKPKLKVISESGEWSVVAPIPVDAPAAPAKHPSLGAPSVSWIYRDAAGDLLGYIHRFEQADGGKEFRPCVLWRNVKSDAMVWRWQAWPEPRPLYGLDLLATRPGTPVVVVEGEKSADAAARLLPDYVCMASPNGSRAAGKADWSPLAGRHVAIWPDSDGSGSKYAAEALACIGEAGAGSVAVVALPEGLTDGWDLADAEEEGWTAAKIEPLIRSAWARAAKSPSARTRKGAVKKDAGDAEAGGKTRGVGAIIDLVTSANVAFWHDSEEKAFATYDVGGHKENHRITSKSFSRWIAGRAHANGLTPPSTGTLGDALRVFDSIAVEEGPLREPFKRCGARDGRWYIDPGYSDWSVIEITPDGWALIAAHDLPMIRPQAMLPMPPIPKLEPKDVSIDLLRPFVNADDDGFRLVVAWLIGALWPRGPFPILVLTGEQGTAKSSLTKLLRQIVDPNIAPTRLMPKDEMDLMTSATHSRVLAIDNVSMVTGQASDILCGIATGAGSSVRAKFTDGEEFIITTKNPIVLNGIPILTSRPDLASRALVVRLKPIPEEDRKSEEEHEEEWAAVAPRVLAALLDVLVCAIDNLPSTRLSRSARMADFERLIEAASPAMGWKPGEFSEAYRGNQDELDAMAIETNDVASAILSMIQDDSPRGWSGSMSQLLVKLNERASESLKRDKSWPRNATALGSRIARITPVLRRHGVTITRTHIGDRKIYVMPDPKTAAPPPASDDTPF